MRVRSNLDRKLMLMVLSPIARAILSLLAGYVSGAGVPAEMVDQFAAALGVAGVVAFNIAWEVIDRKRAEVRGAMRVLDELSAQGLRG